MISFYILLKLIRDIYLFPPIPCTSVSIVLNQECILNILGVFFQSLLYCSKGLATNSVRQIVFFALLIIVIFLKKQL